MSGFLPNVRLLRISSEVSFISSLRSVSLAGAGEQETRADWKSSWSIFSSRYLAAASCTVLSSRLNSSFDSHMTTWGSKSNHLISSPYKGYCKLNKVSSYHSLNDVGESCHSQTRCNYLQRLLNGTGSLTIALSEVSNSLAVFAMVLQYNEINDY